ncbi:MAG: ion transporter, partial [Clostridia bacterium]|nr:ion transporter [Clostridia bacterium]
MTSWKKLKGWIFRVISPAQKGDKLSLSFDIFYITLVLLSAVSVFFELIGVPAEMEHILHIFENVSVGFFIAEYLLKFLVCEYEYPEARNKWEAMKEFAISFESFIDIISILSILANGIPKELAFLRLIKLVKLVRLAKISEHLGHTRKSSKMEILQRRVYVIIDKDEKGDVLSRIYDILSVALIFISISFLAVETFPLSVGAQAVIRDFEKAIAVIFLVEYVLRVWIAPLNEPGLRPDKARMKYIFSFMSFIDLLSIVPVFVVFLPSTAGILKIFKLCKIVRLVKASRYIGGIAAFGKSIAANKKKILLSLVAISLLIVICSLLMYSFEHDTQPEVFQNGFSGIVYSVMMMTGSDTEIVTLTPMGQALSTLMLLLGACLFGVPLAIVSAGFEKMIQKQSGEEEEEEKEKCEGKETSTPFEQDAFSVAKQYAL